MGKREKTGRHERERGKGKRGKKKKAPQGNRERGRERVGKEKEGGRDNQYLLSKNVSSHRSDPQEFEKSRRCKIAPHV